ncbi:PREDICTED: EPIDERMAL PATTERNING FACTOR-like protein 4 [Fragaria vesca subsp. vesca]|uniref:EPIDERMAL PATTERNING FACTOR-like protein 4 n=1 Tax=Fragaria vesca subsp. vesca TaxID=101020 RepID=UPI0002C336DA|nr:PREDICTED: EPIDERMAL PATTERNING FACTOR-like protein 4 [Fragaria vesca subsp. vesca]
MGVLRHRRPHHHSTLTCTAALAFLFIITSASAIRTTPTQLGDTEVVSGSSIPEDELTAEKRQLGGPGSAPPRCRSKCGRCSPCKAVHVPIQPGLSIPLEYYPEAWRCKCGNKLFMP